ncbi:putative rhodanese-related sulfurtransferase [uncultured Clostridium sp.]|uniref:rhodanese-like domain-containing protein n=1 Tax=uncultured Clostridium sp. TaxID=59620 RepID=UPI000821FE67|nr:rhodanese-like domain-containing protein [uncultured Clostridium sp.]SCJ99218.1 putative rhodanese-related sulfurtransferase [uncultured Clostridium sp.]
MIKSINNISALKLINEVENLLILDVRRFSEFKSGKIPNSINIPVDDLEFELDELEEFKEKPILVYCKSGIRSSVACSLLEEEGFSNLYNLRGGILDYTGNIE